MGNRTERCMNNAYLIDCLTRPVPPELADVDKPVLYRLAGQFVAERKCRHGFEYFDDKSGDAIREEFLTWMEVYRFLYGAGSVPRQTSPRQVAVQST